MMRRLDEILQAEVNDETAYLLVHFFEALQHDIEQLYFAQARRHAAKQLTEEENPWVFWQDVFDTTTPDE